MIRAKNSLNSLVFSDIELNSKVDYNMNIVSKYESQETKEA